MNAKQALEAVFYGMPADVAQKDWPEVRKVLEAQAIVWGVQGKDSMVDLIRREIIRLDKLYT